MREQSIEVQSQTNSDRKF